MHREEFRLHLIRRWVQKRLSAGTEWARLAQYRSEGPAHILDAVPVMWPELGKQRPLAELLEAASAAFAELEVRWCLSGTLAAIVHGSWQISREVDIALDLAATPLDALIQVLRRHDVRPRLADSAHFAHDDLLLFEHAPTGGPLDVVLAGPQLLEGIVAGAEVRDVAGVNVPVARAEHVLIMKLLRGKTKDIDQAVSILLAQGDRLASSVIEDALELAERALDRHDPLSLFRLLRSATAERR